MSVPSGVHVACPETPDEKRRDGRDHGSRSVVSVEDSNGMGTVVLRTRRKERPLPVRQDENTVLQVRRDMTKTEQMVGRVRVFRYV